MVCFAALLANLQHISIDEIGKQALDCCERKAGFFSDVIRFGGAARDHFDEPLFVSRQREHQITVLLFLLSNEAIDLDEKPFRLRARAGEAQGPAEFLSRLWG